MEGEHPDEIDMDQLTMLEKAQIERQVDGLSETYLSVRTQLSKHNKKVDPMGVGENLMEDFLSERALMLDKFSSGKKSKNDYELLNARQPAVAAKEGGRKVKGAKIE